MKIFSKVDEIWLILFRIFHWFFFWTWFFDIWSYLRINWLEMAQNRQKSHQKPQFPGKWSIFRKNENDHEIGNWILIQNQPLPWLFIFFLFFYYFNTIGIRKYSRDALKLWLMAYFVQNFSLIIFSVSVFWYLVPPTHKLAKNSRKMVKMAIFDNFSLIYA